MILPVNDACRRQRALSNLLLAPGALAGRVIYIFRIYLRQQRGGCRG